MALRGSPVRVRIAPSLEVQSFQGIYETTTLTIVQQGRLMLVTILRYLTLVGVLLVPVMILTVL